MRRRKRSAENDTTSDSTTIDNQNALNLTHDPSIFTSTSIDISISNGNSSTETIELLNEEQ